jgi:hypothetical protein
MSASSSFVGSVVEASSLDNLRKSSNSGRVNENTARAMEIVFSSQTCRILVHVDDNRRTNLMSSHWRNTWASTSGGWPAKCDMALVRWACRNQFRVWLIEIQGVKWLSISAARLIAIRVKAIDKGS